MELSEVEKSIVDLMRELKPHEVIEIKKDQLGRVDHYIVHRSQKVVVNSC